MLFANTIWDFLRSHRKSSENLSLRLQEADEEEVEEGKNKNNNRNKYKNSGQMWWAI